MRETRRQWVSSSIQFIFCHRQPETRRRYSCLYQGRRFLYPLQPEQGSLCALRCFLSYLFDLLKSQVPSVEELEAEEQVKKHCKAQRLPCPSWKGYKNIFPWYKVENHLPLIVGGGKFEIKLPQRCCEAFVKYLRRDAVTYSSNISAKMLWSIRRISPQSRYRTELDLKRNLNKTFTGKTCPYEYRTCFFSVYTWPSRDWIAENRGTNCSHICQADDGGQGQGCNTPCLQPKQRWAPTHGQPGQPEWIWHCKGNPEEKAPSWDANCTIRHYPPGRTCQGTSSCNLWGLEWMFHSPYSTEDLWSCSSVQSGFLCVDRHVLIFPRCF